jgi:two-component system NtrC family response regulator
VRREDVPQLAEHFARIASIDLGVSQRAISPEVVAALSAYDWPGNIRELANVIERAVLLCDGSTITESHLPAEILRARRDPAIPDETTLRGTERAMILRALQDHRWNQTRAAVALGITRDNLRYRIRKYNIGRDGEASDTL